MKPTDIIPYKVSTRACGDFAVERFIGGRVVRWGTYATKREAIGACRLANAGLAGKTEGRREGEKEGI